MTSTATSFQRFIRRPILTHTYFFYNGRHIYFFLSPCFSTIHRFFSHLIYIDFFLSLMIEKTHDGYDDSWWIWWTMLFWFHLSLTYTPITRSYTRFIHCFIFVFSPYE